MSRPPTRADLAGRNQAAAAWCGEVNASVHSEICAVPGGPARDRAAAARRAALAARRLRRQAHDPEGRQALLYPVRIGRYSVPNRLIGRTVTVLVDGPGIGQGEGQVLRVIEAVTGEVHAEHRLVAPGETSIVDAHYGGPRPDKPQRAARPRTQAEKDFLA